MVGPGKEFKMDKRIAEWLASGDTGSSSKAIMLWLSSGVIDSSWGADTPRDAGDLARCLRLLEVIPEWKMRMPEMAGAGGLWPTFIKHWDNIVATFMQECNGKIPEKYGEWPDFTKTYELMKSAHATAYEADNPDYTEVAFGKGCTIRIPKGFPFQGAFK